MNKQIKSQFVRTAARLKNNRTKVDQEDQSEQIDLEKKHLTTMRAFHGCAKTAKNVTKKKMRKSRLLFTASTTANFTLALSPPHS